MIEKKIGDTAKIADQFGLLAPVTFDVLDLQHITALGKPVIVAPIKRPL